MSGRSDDARPVAVAPASLERWRSRLANLRSAAEALDAVPDAPAEQAARLRAVILAEAAALGEDFERLGAPEEAAAGTAAPVRTAELVRALARRVGAIAGVLCEHEGDVPDDTVVAEPAALADAVSRAAASLHERFGVDAFSTRARAGDGLLHLDLVWRYHEAQVEALLAWQRDALLGHVGGGPSLKQIVRRGDGDAWLNLERGTDRAHLRLLLPVQDRG